MKRQGGLFCGPLSTTVCVALLSLLCRSSPRGPRAPRDPKKSTPSHHSMNSIAPLYGGCIVSRQIPSQKCRRFHREIPIIGMDSGMSQRILQSPVG